MSQGLIIFIAIGAILGYILVGFINDIQEADDKLITQEKMIAKEDMKYHQKDAIGQTILVFKDQPFEKKLGIWQRSPLHQEYMNFFPNFMEMKAFINDRIVDPDFQKQLTEKVSEVEDAYFAGEITQPEAKEKLSNL
ncbi:MAG: hypothetical protein B6D59_07305 [Campylobacteraceae bacterium 4484_4]|nr:MAG: hypothetical protein B6D59_07305 [Campylobacteraceae bacterium 4484_4]